MDTDLTQLLDEWPYQPGRINVRLIERADGDQHIQVRLDLGLLQFHRDGRPDGQRPHGFESLLDLVEAQLDGGFPIEGEPSADEQEESSGEPEAFTTDSGTAETGEGPLPPPRREAEGDEREARLSAQQVAMLRDEAVQYYHRYLALLALEDFERVVRDTTRNLRVLALIEKHAEDESDRASVAPTRAHVTMMRARALASMALRDNEPKAAVAAINEGIEALRKHFDAIGHADLFERSSEVQVLQGMKQALMPKLPVSQKAELRKRLDDAVAHENYRLAAILRDELNSMPD
ncbi:MAG: UvrB/UvrC motif-containing protein [Planctomycetota bacterium]